MADSNKRKILERVKTLIQGLSLTGINDANIVAVDAADDSRVDESFDCMLGDLPGVLLMSVAGETIDPLGNSGNSGDDIGYPVFVGMFASKCGDAPTATDDPQALWRERVRKTFIRQRLTDSEGNTLAYTCLCEPKDQVNIYFRRNNDVWFSFMVLRFISHELRG